RTCPRGFRLSRTQAFRATIRSSRVMKSICRARRPNSRFRSEAGWDMVHIGKTRRQDDGPAWRNATPLPPAPSLVPGVAGGEQETRPRDISPPALLYPGARLLRPAEVGQGEAALPVPVEGQAARCLRGAVGPLGQGGTAARRVPS